MKNLFLAILMIATVTSFAQGKRGDKSKMSSEDRVEFQVKRMKKNLNLNETQSAQVTTLLTEQAKKREAKRAEMQAKKEAGKPSPEEREAMKAKMQAEQNGLKEQMKKILTPEQYSKWESNREEKKEKFLEKARERKSAKEEK
jgi:periplasmic protein CpxP/Spy